MQVQSTLMSALYVILTTVVLVSFAAGVVGIIRLHGLTYHPMRLPRGQMPGPARFALSDILTLMVMLQPCLAPLLIVQKPEFAPGQVCAIVISLLLCATVSVGWYSGVQTLSNRGVMATWRRVVYLLFVGPLSAVASVLAIIGLISLLVCIFQAATAPSIAPLIDNALWLLSFNGLAAVAFALAAGLTHWVAQGAEPRTAGTPLPPGAR